MNTKQITVLLAISTVVFGVLIVGAAPWGLIRATVNPAKIEIADVQGQLRVDWIVAGIAWAFQLALAGAATATRARSGVVHGIAGFVRAIVPCTIAIAAIVLGGAAIVVPGVVLAVLLSLTGAAAGESPGTTPSQALDASVAAVRAHWRDAAVAVAAIVAADIAIAAIAPFVLVHAGAPKLQLEQARDATRVVVLAYTLASPFAASVLAGVYAKAPK